MKWADLDEDERREAANCIEAMVLTNEGWKYLAMWMEERAARLQARLAAVELGKLLDDEKRRQDFYQDQSEMLFIKTFLRKPQELIEKVKNEREAREPALAEVLGSFGDGVNG